MGSKRASWNAADINRVQRIKHDVRRNTRRARGLVADDPRHGTRGAYLEWGCRCDACRVANTEHHRRQKADRIARGLPADDPRHGKRATYTEWGCRCEACTAANTSYKVLPKQVT